jgi:hypothetical protein
MMHSLRSQNTALSRLSRHLEQLLFDAAIELLVDANEIPNWSQATIVLDQIHDGEHLPICQWSGGQYKTDQEKHGAGEPYRPRVQQLHIAKFGRMERVTDRNR